MNGDTCGTDSQGVYYEGYCWYLGGFGESCDTACSGRGGCNLVGTRDLVGSGGNNSNCQAVLDLLPVFSGMDPVSTGSSDAIGCHQYSSATGLSTKIGRRDTGTTTCSASGEDGGIFLRYDSRACACG